MLKRVAKSVPHALRGMKIVWREEHNFRFQTAIACIVFALALLLGFTPLETFAIVIAIILVLAAEMLNTIVEDLLDKIEPNHHPLVGKIKDMMAGYVLLHSAGAVAIGVLTFLHHFRGTF